MATLASVLIIISSSLVSDIWEHGLHKQLTGQQEVFANRVVSAAVGLVSLAIALKPPALILVLTGFSWAVIASTNLWPLIFGLYVKRTSKLAVLVSMIAGSLTAVFWTWAKQPWGVHGFIAGGVVGLVVLLVLSLVQPARALRSEQ